MRDSICKSTGATLGQDRRTVARQVGHPRLCILEQEPTCLALRAWGPAFLVLRRWNAVCLIPDRLEISFSSRQMSVRELGFAFCIFIFIL